MQAHPPVKISGSSWKETPKLLRLKSYREAPNPRTDPRTFASAQEAFWALPLALGLGE